MLCGVWVGGWLGENGKELKFNGSELCCGGKYGGAAPVFAVKNAPKQSLTDRPTYLGTESLCTSAFKSMSYQSQLTFFY